MVIHQSHNPIYTIFLKWCLESDVLNVMFLIESYFS